MDIVMLPKYHIGKISPIHLAKFHRYSISAVFAHENCYANCLHGML